MGPRAPNPLTDNALLVYCRRGLLVDHLAAHEAHQMCRDQVDRSFQAGLRFAQIGDEKGREVPIADMRRRQGGGPKGVAERDGKWRSDYSCSWLESGSLSFTPGASSSSYHRAWCRLTSSLESLPVTQAQFIG